MGAYGGRKDIMEMVAPAGPMYQAGTLSGNPLAMTAGIETLKRLKDRSIKQSPGMTPCHDEALVSGGGQLRTPG